MHPCTVSLIVIFSGTRELETSITPAEHPVVISEDTRAALEMFGTATGKVTSGKVFFISFSQ